jgi:hypothetical protein
MFRALSVFVRPRVLAVCAVLATCVVLPENRAFATGVVPDSAGLPTPVIANGTVLSSDGSAVAGAMVVLFADPTPATLDQLADGATVNSVPLSYATTDSAGRWSLRVPKNVDLSAQTTTTADDPYVNLKVESFTAEGVDETFFPVDLVPYVNTTNIATQAVTDDSDGETDNENAGGTVILNGQAMSLYGPDESSVSLISSQIPGSSGGFDPNVGGMCGDKRVPGTHPHHRILTVIGRQFSSTSGVKVNFNYGDGASNTLGIGVSAQASGGTWSAKVGSSSTNKVATSGVQTFPQVVGATNHDFYSYFTYAEYETGCTGAPLSYEMRPTAWDGGEAEGTDTSDPTFPKIYCVPEQATATFTAHRSKASTKSDGVSISAVIGISLSSQSGYTTSTSIKFSYTRSGALCGLHGYPGAIGAASDAPAPGLLKATT